METNLGINIAHPRKEEWSPAVLEALLDAVSVRAVQGQEHCTYQ